MDKEDVEDAILNAREIRPQLTVRELNGIPHAIIPKDHHVEILEGLLPHPPRVREVFNTNDLDSFIQYVEKYELSTPSSEHFCTLIGDGKSPSMGARYIFDYHSTLHAGNKSHSTTYSAVVSDEWQTWIGGHEKQLSQNDFGEFLEKNSVDIIVPNSEPNSPSGAKMLSLADDLQLFSTIDVDDRIERTSGGVSIKYSESVSGQINGTKVDIPKAFHIAIPMHVGGPAYVLKALFRFRRNGNRVTMGYELYRHHKMYLHALDKLKEQLTDALTITVFK